MVTSMVFEMRDVDLGLSEKEQDRVNFHSGWDFGARLGLPFITCVKGQLKIL